MAHLKLGPNTENLIDRIFGRFTVISYGGRQGRGKRTFWYCQCRCGIKRLVKSQNLKSGNSKSCGCLQKESAIKYNLNNNHGFKHGHYHSPEYISWFNMKYRCNYPKHPRYNRYGGRGIKICRRWHDFRNFLEDMGLKLHPKAHIGRKNHNKNYQPSNCRWETPCRVN